MFDEILNIDDITEDMEISDDTTEDENAEIDTENEENETDFDDETVDNDTEEDETIEDDTTEDNEETDDTEANIDALAEILAKKMGISQDEAADTIQNTPTGMTEEMAHQILQEELKTNPEIAYINFANNLSEAKLNSFKGQYGDVLNQQMLQKEIAKVSERYSDFIDYESDLKDIIMSQIDTRYKDHDRLSDEAAYEMAYLMKKVEKLESQAKTAFEAGKKSAKAMKETKKKINTPKRQAKNENNVADELKGLNIINPEDNLFI